MAHSFSIPVKVSAHEIVETVKRMTTERGGAFHGSELAGSFAGGGVQGTYAVSRGQVNVTLTRGPSYSSWETIEAEIRKFF